MTKDYRNITILKFVRIDLYGAMLAHIQVLSASSLSYDIVGCHHIQMWRILNLKVVLEVSKITRAAANSRVIARCCRPLIYDGEAEGETYFISRAGKRREGIHRRT